MPNLLLLVPCENLIVAQSGVLSFINVLQEVTISEVPEIVPENAALPMRWFVFCEWEISPEDRGRQLEQKFALVDENGRERMAGQAQFNIQPDTERHRLMASLNAFPILPAGVYSLEVNYREVGAERWIRSGSYPIRVKR